MPVAAAFSSTTTRVLQIAKFQKIFMKAMMVPRTRTLKKPNDTLFLICICFVISIHPSRCFTIHHESPDRLHSRPPGQGLSIGASLLIHHRQFRLPLSLSLSTTGKSSKNSPKISSPSPRIIAVQALIENTTATTSPVSKLEKIDGFHNLPSQRDKAFTRNLVSTTTRRKGQIDALLSILCDKYPPKCGRKYTGVVQACMRMGAAQILFMDVKDFAAVSETGRFCFILCYCSWLGPCLTSPPCIVKNVPPVR